MERMERMERWDPLRRESNSGLSIIAWVHLQSLTWLAVRFAFNTLRLTREHAFTE